MALWSYVVLFMAAQAAHSSDIEADPKIIGDLVNPPVDIGCLLKHCSVQSGSCALDSTCRSAMLCSKTCMDGWNDDKTPEKIHVQNCTTKCSLTHTDQTYDNFMSCLTENKCVSFPPINNTCRGPNVHPLKQLSLKDLQGTWWTVKGYHPVYDCYPCQLLKFTPINATSWSYNPTYEGYLTNDSLKLVSENMVMPLSAAGTNISYSYHTGGLEQRETWWLIDGADDGSYILVYYCANTLDQWYNEGALVIARNRTLAEETFANIASSFKKAVGLDLSQFCTPSTSTSCPD